jgi:hypothetical protein
MKQEKTWRSRILAVDDKHLITLTLSAILEKRWI